MTITTIGTAGAAAPAASARKANTPRKGYLGRALLCGAALAVLAGCAERKTFLPGQRENLRAVMSDQIPSDNPGTPVNEARPISLPAPVVNANWVQAPGTPGTRTSHPALSAAPAPLFAAPIGAGDTRKTRITAEPVVSDGRVFTLDAEGRVTATSTAGQQLWQVSLIPAQDRAGQASGGGLAVSGNRLFVTTGFGRLTALDVASGGELWEQRLGGVGNAPPVVSRGLVYLTAGDDQGWALEEDTGRIAWQLTSPPDVTGISGGPAPAVSDQYAVFAFGSGDVQTVFRQGGMMRWQTAVSGRRNGFARANISDITGDPVIVGDTVYVGSQTGRLVALELDSGERLWTAREGALSPVWAAGGSLFFVSDGNELIRLDAATGDRIWGQKLGLFTKGKPKRQGAIYGQYGPILAGGRLVVASTDGYIHFYDPTSGAETGAVEIPGGAATNPVVAGGVLYVVSKKGVLHAYR